MSGWLFGFPRRVAFRVPGRGSLRVASVGRPRVPLPFILMANFLVAVGFCPRPPSDARFARGVGDFVAVMLRMFFLAVFLPLSGGTCSGGWLGGMSGSGFFRLGVVSVWLIVSPPPKCRSWPLGPGKCGWPFGLVLCAAKYLGLGCQMEGVWGEPEAWLAAVRWGGLGR